MTEDKFANKKSAAWGEIIDAVRKIGISSK